MENHVLFIIFIISSILFFLFCLVKNNTNSIQYINPNLTNMLHDSKIVFIASVTL